MTFVNSVQATASPKQRALRAHPWFGDLDAQVLAALDAHSRWLELGAGQTVFHEGQPANACLLVCSGCLQGLRHTADGDEKIFGQIGPGGWASVLSLFMRRPRHLHSIRALGTSEACLFDGPAFRTLCQAHAVLACRVLEHGAGLVDHHTDQIDWLTSSSAEQRLADYILRFGKPQSNQPILLPLTYTQIAVKLGMRSETLSRVLAKWRQQGYIAKRRSELRVLDIDFFKRLAANGLSPQSHGAQGAALGSR